MTKHNRKQKRNKALIDIWSAVHVLSAAALALIIGPIPAFIVASLWEPLEIFVVSPIVAKFGITFGYETFRNSLSDIFFNAVGVLCVVVTGRL